METALHEFITHKDTDVLLVATSKHIDNDGMDSVASVLLQPHHKEAVREISWDLLSMVARHLNSPESSTFSLINLIAEVGQAKEMCIAFLEALDETRSVDTIQMLLESFKTVLNKIRHNEKLLSSTLNSIRVFVQRSCLAVQSKHELKMAATANEGNTEIMTDEQEEDSGDLSVGVITQISFAVNSLHLLELPVRDIDELYSLHDGDVPYNGWSDVQRTCLSILTDLLGMLMTCSLGLDDTIKEEEVILDKMLRCLKLCHCGALNILKWRVIERRSRRSEDDEDSIEDSCIFSSQNVALLSCLLLKEDCSYMPCVLTHQYRLRIGLTHVNLLLDCYGISNHHITNIVLDVLEGLINRISRHSLLTVLLHDSIYKQSLLLLCHVMTTSPITSNRQKAVSLLCPFIDCFEERGRHKLFDILMREVNHTGVIGLLIQRLKDEVNKALGTKSDQETISCFTGEGLRGLYRQFLFAPNNADVLSEFDRYIAGLNFLRFLLLKDGVTVNKTMVWSERQSLQTVYLKPLRSAIVYSRMYCQSFIDNPEEIDKQRREHKHELHMNVQVLGEDKIPEITKREELELLQKSLLRLDMMTSVLTRVEELLDNN